MKFAVCSVALHDYSTDKAFALFKGCGYRNVDLHTVHLPLSMPAKDVDALVRLAQSYGLSIVSLASVVGAGLSDADPAKRKAALAEINQTIDLASRVGAGVIRINPGNLKEFDDRMKNLVIPALKESLGHAERKNIRLSIENHSGGIAETPEGCRKMCDALPSKHFGILYDPGNLLGFLQDYKKVLEWMPDRIVHVHLKDGVPAKFNDDYAPQRLSCTAVGKGNLDIPFILRELDRKGYSGYTSVEYECWHPEYPLPPVVTGLKEYLDYLNRLSR